MTCSFLFEISSLPYRTFLLNCSKPLKLEATLSEIIVEQNSRNTLGSSSARFVFRRRCDRSAPLSAWRLIVLHIRSLSLCRRSSCEICSVQFSWRLHVRAETDDSAAKMKTRKQPNKNMKYFRVPAQLLLHMMPFCFVEDDLQEGETKFLLRFLFFTFLAVGTF